MWSPNLVPNIGSIAPNETGRDILMRVRQQLREMLSLLDEHSVSAAAASVDLAVHQLERELGIDPVG